MDQPYHNRPPQSQFSAFSQNYNARPQQAATTRRPQNGRFSTQELQETLRQTFARLEQHARQFSNPLERNDLNFLLQYSKNSDELMTRHEHLKLHL